MHVPPVAMTGSRITARRDAFDPVDEGDPDPDAGWWLGRLL